MKGVLLLRADAVVEPRTPSSGGSAAGGSVDLHRWMGRRFEQRLPQGGPFDSAQGKLRPPLH
jgi:hypothetical protein